MFCSSLLFVVHFVHCSWLQPLLIALHTTDNHSLSIICKIARDMIFKNIWTIGILQVDWGCFLSCVYLLIQIPSKRVFSGKNRYAHKNSSINSVYSVSVMKNRVDKSNRWTSFPLCAFEAMYTWSTKSCGPLPRVLESRGWCDGKENGLVSAD